MDQIRSDKPEGAPACAQTADAGAPLGRCWAGAPFLRPAQAGRRHPPAARRAAGDPGPGAQHHRCPTEPMARPRPGLGRGGDEGARARRARRGAAPSQGQARRGHHGQRATRAEDRRPGGWPPFGPPEAEAMSQVLSPATGRAYGLARVARVWHLSRATVYRHRAAPAAAAPTGPVRRGPVGACSDAELLEHVRAQILGSRLHGEGYRKIWARLRHAGIRTAARRVRRLMGQHGLLAPHRVGRPEQRAHDGTITTTAVDVMWGTDMTETVTLREGRARVFIAVDHCSGECVGSHAARSGNRFEALEPVRQGVLRYFGGIEKNAAKGLSLRHDHGSNYMSGDFQDEIAFLGVESSPSFVRQPEGNGVAERFIRTLKENFLWVHTFDTIEELRRGLQDFIAHYNATWLVARHGYCTPNQIRAEQRSLAPCPSANLPLAA